MKEKKNFTLREGERERERVRRRERGRERERERKVWKGGFTFFLSLLLDGVLDCVRSKKKSTQRIEKRI